MWLKFIFSSRSRMRTRHFLAGVSTSMGNTWNYVKIEADAQLSCSPTVVTKSSQFNKAACVTILCVMGNWHDFIFLLPYTFSIPSPLLTSLQQLLTALSLLSRCLTAFRTPFLRSFLLSKTLAPSSVNLSFLMTVAAAKLLQSCLTLCDPVDCSLPGSSVHGILRQEYWSELPCSSPGDLPDLGIQAGSPTLQADSLWLEPPGKPKVINQN